jgi:hypothetical protein
MVARTRVMPTGQLHGLFLQTPEHIQTLFVLPIAVR